MHKTKNIIVVSICLIVMISIGVWGSYIWRQNVKTLLVVGDSIGEGAGCSDPALKWYKKLIPYMKDNYGINLEITNVSMGGNTSYAGYVRTMNLDGDNLFDYVIVCFGQNDAVEDFGLYYEILLRIVREKYPTAKIIAILESSQREYTEKIQKIQELCAYYGIYVADTIAAFNNSGLTYEELCDDGTHPNDSGYELYFNTVAEVMAQCHEDSELSVDKSIEPINDKVEQFKTYRYYSRDDLKRVDDLTYKLCVEEYSGRLGIDYTTIEGENWIRIIGSDDTKWEKKIIWDKSFALRYIEVFTEDFTNKEELIVEFSSKEMKDNFNGIVISGF